jgi:hypothetical protein
MRGAPLDVIALRRQIAADMGVGAGAHPRGPADAVSNRGSGGHRS